MLVVPPVCRQTSFRRSTFSTVANNVPAVLLSTGELVPNTAAAPTNLSYPSPNTFTKGTLITSLSPTVTGAPTNYTVNPALPAGLTLNSTSGVISGTPSEATVQTGYEITATNASTGSAKFVVLITVQSGTFYSIASGNWNDNNTWSTVSGGSALGAGIYPAAGDNVIIEGGFNVTATANAACSSVTFTNATAASLTINDGITTDVSEAITIPRPASSSNQVIVGAGILNAGSVAFTNGSTANGHEISISTGTVTVTGNVTQTGSTGSATIAFSGAGTLNLGGSFLTSATGTLTLAPGCTVNYNGAAQTVGNFTYNNLILSGTGAKTTTGVSVNTLLSMEGTATASAAPSYNGSAILQYNSPTGRTAGPEWIPTFGAGGVVIANTGTVTLNAAKVFSTSVPLTINNNATLNTSAGNLAITLGGDFHNSGTFSANASPITITGNAAQSIDGFSTKGLSLSLKQEVQRP